MTGASDGRKKGQERSDEPVSAYRSVSPEFGVVSGCLRIVFLIRSRVFGFSPCARLRTAVADGSDLGGVAAAVRAHQQMKS